MNPTTGHVVCHLCAAVVPRTFAVVDGSYFQCASGLDCCRRQVDGRRQRLLEYTVMEFAVPHDPARPHDLHGLRAFTYAVFTHPYILKGGPSQ